LLHSICSASPLQNATSPDNSTDESMRTKQSYGANLRDLLT
jgi:hypothetical protein